MKLIKLTALPLALFMSVSSLVSCERDEELKKTTDYSKNGIVLSGAQETPAVPSSALGSMDVFYSKASKTLSYTVNWSGLTGAVTAMHIHGLAPAGFAAGIVQTFSTSAIVKCSSVSITSCGKYQGTLLVDGLAVKENDLLNGFYYVNIHTAAYPGGEIRAQILFQ